MADEALVSRMNALTIYPGTDCSEIAEAIRAAAGGAGSILRITPSPGKELSLVEYGQLATGFLYHEVFTDGQFAYDPRFSSDAVPLKEYLDGITLRNPGAVIVPR